MKILIRDALIVDVEKGRVIPGDILIENGKIARMVSSLPVRADRIIQANGLYAAPGLIDLHCHLREPGEEKKEDVKSGCKAAANGGVTTLLAMPNTQPAMDCPEVVREVLLRSRKVGMARVLPVGAITRNRAGEELVDFEKLVKAGVVAFSDDGSWVSNSALMKQALLSAGRLGKFIISHAEDPSLCLGGQINEGKLSQKHGIRGIPASSEVVAVARDVILAGETKTPLHLAHLSSRESLPWIHFARRNHFPVSSEVTPHHLLLNESFLHNLDYRGKVKPPLRTKEDSTDLLEALRTGKIDVFASDHAPHGEASQTLPFEQIPFGISSLDLFLPLLITALTVRGKMSLPQALRKATLLPAKLLGWDSLGRLAVGNPADLILFDPHKRFRVKDEHLQSRGKNCPYVGKILYGWVYWTFYGGTITKMDGKVIENE